MPLSVRTSPVRWRDELDLPAGDRAQHLVGADRVEGGDAVEDQDCDLHDEDLGRSRRVVARGRNANVR